MVRIRAAALAAIPLLALSLTACVSQSQYDALAQINKDLETKNTALQQQVDEQQKQLAAMHEENKFVEQSSLLFPSGGYQLGPDGKKELDTLVPKLKAAQNAKIVVYGYTDNTPVGAALRKQGIATNVDLSSRRADAVVNYLVAEGIDPTVISAKGRGDSHPVATNDTEEGRAANRRIEIVLTGPGAS
jgi:chemotaxis protein MotB